MESLIQINRELVEADVANNIKYAKDHSWNYTKEEDGLIFEILKNGEGEAAVSKDRVTFSYTITTLDEDLVYSSEHDGLKTFVIDYQEVEAGLNNIVKSLHSGDSLRVILPPYLAFGITGDGNKVPPRTSLVYFLKLESVERPK